MNEVFEVEVNECDKVVLKVNADDALTIAMNPFVSSDMAYITVTKGKNHILTVVKKDGTTYSFHWGHNGYTLISDSLEELRKNVVKYIKSQNILLDYDGTTPSEVYVSFNERFAQWELGMYLRNGGMSFSYFRCVDPYFSCIDPYLARKKAEEILRKNGFRVSTYEWYEDVSNSGTRLWKLRI